MLNKLLEPFLRELLFEGLITSGFLPTDLDPVVAWFDGSTLLPTPNLDFVSDLSGSGNDAIQNTAAEQAEVGVRTVNGLNVITARASDKYLDVPTAPLAVGMYGVVNFPSVGAGTNLAVLGSAAVPNYEFFVRSLASGDISFDGGAAGSGKYSLNGSGFSVFDSNHTTGEGPLSGANILGGVFDAPQNIQRFLNRSGVNSDAVGLDLCELVWTSRELTEAEKLQLDIYFAVKWGLEDILIKPGSGVLSQDGSYLLMQDGSKILLQG